MKLNPVTKLRLDRFLSIRRAKLSMIIVVSLIVLSLFAELIANNKALIVYHNGKLHFPTYTKVLLGTDFGLDYKYEVEYRELKQQLKGSTKGWVLMPIIPYNQFEQDFKDDGTFPPYAPSLKEGHPLGTDRIGRDIFARIFYGFRIAIFFSLAFVSITTIFGTLVGCLMGYWGGKFDIIVQRFIEIWERIPFLYMVMISVAIYQPDMIVFLIIFCVFGWAGKTWTVRAMTYRERERDYILAAKTMGASTWRIITVHILPNVIVVVVTMLPFAIAGGISSLTALDYLGFGLRPPAPSWGELLKQGIATFDDAPWILTSVATAMSLILVMIAFIGEGLREAFDPKKYTVYK
ncbi:MAG: peptide ABC transporter permease [Spirochaetaceae bacterium 4572_7]|nr:MAG: peptide ABC transporter permease [Spirochaetaceae bacterium 4572_7]